MSTSREYEIVLTPETEGGCSVAVPALPGSTSPGETREEALSMIREAIEDEAEGQTDLSAAGGSWRQAKAFAMVERQGRVRASVVRGRPLTTVWISTSSATIAFRPTTIELFCNPNSVAEASMSVLTATSVSLIDGE